MNKKTVDTCGDSLHALYKLAKGFEITCQLDRKQIKIM